LAFFAAVEMRIPLILVMLEKVELPPFLSRWPCIDLAGNLSTESIAALLGELYALSRETTLKELLDSPPERKMKYRPRVRGRFVLAALTASLVVVSLVVFSAGIMLIGLTQTSPERMYVLEWSLIGVGAGRWVQGDLAELSALGHRAPLSVYALQAASSIALAALWRKWRQAAQSVSARRLQKTYPSRKP
jgi:hypothetical protein